MKIRCPFCNFETRLPITGKIHECEGECYTTYGYLRPGDEELRFKMRLIEIFFLDYGDTPRATPSEIDEKCEFVVIDGPNPGEKIMFAREHRPSLDEIDSLREGASDDYASACPDLIERLESAIDRFKRDQHNVAPAAKLLSDIRVVEALVSIIRERLEKSQ